MLLNVLKIFQYNLVRMRSPNVSIVTRNTCLQVETAKRLKDKLFQILKEKPERTIMFQRSNRDFRSLNSVRSQISLRTYSNNNSNLFLVVLIKRKNENKCANQKDFTNYVESNIQNIPFRSNKDFQDLVLDLASLHIPKIKPIRFSKLTYLGGMTNVQIL